jgi:hypothetical protein
MLKKLSLLVLTATLILSCSKEQEIDELAECEIVWGGGKNCSGTDPNNATCIYKLRYGVESETAKEVEVNKSTYDYYSERWENEEVCWTGNK